MAVTNRLERLAALAEMVRLRETAALSDLRREIDALEAQIAAARAQTDNVVPDAFARAGFLGARRALRQRELAALNRRLARARAEQERFRAAVARATARAEVAGHLARHSGGRAGS